MNNQKDGMLMILPTDKGNWCVRPASWGGIRDAKGKITENIQHLAVFRDESDAKSFVHWKEQVPFEIGMRLWYLNERKKEIWPMKVSKIVMLESRTDTYLEYDGEDEYYKNFEVCLLPHWLGYLVFQDKKEAEACLDE